MRPDGFNLPVPCHRQVKRGRYLLGTTETVLMALTPFRCTLVGVIPLAAACNLLTPIAFVGEHRKKISPEFDKLANERVAVLVWTDPSTLFDYPHARLELASFVGEKLSAETAQRRLNVDVVDTRDIETLLQKNIGAQIDPAEVGQALKTDYVIYLEILTFQMRDPAQPQFLRGVIDASVSVHDMKADPDQLRRYELTPVQCRHPEGPPVLMSAVNALQIREATYRKFAELVARKFYEHTQAL
jgi:hypothetical protein